MHFKINSGFTHQKKPVINWVYWHKTKSAMRRFLFLTLSVF